MSATATGAKLIKAIVGISASALLVAQFQILTAEPGPPASVVIKPGSHSVSVLPGWGSEPALVELDVEEPQVVSVRAEAEYSPTRVVIRQGDQTVLGDSGSEYGTAFIEPLYIEQPGIYQLEVFSEYGQPTDVQAFSVQDSVSEPLAMDAAPVAVTFSPGEKAEVPIDLIGGQQVSLNVVNSEDHPSDIYEAYDLSLRLVDSEGGVVAEPSPYFSWGSYIDTFAVTSTGRYTLEVDPTGAASGHVWLQAHDVGQTTSKQATVGSEWTRFQSTRPGGTYQFTFAAAAGLRFDPTLVAPEDAIFKVEGPDGRIIQDWEWVSVGADQLVTPEAGEYRISVTLRPYAGVVALRLTELPISAPLNLSLNASPVTDAIIHPGDSRNFNFEIPAGTRAEVRISSPGDFEGSAIVEEEWEYVDVASGQDGSLGPFEAPPSSSRTITGVLHAAQPGTFQISVVSYEGSAVTDLLPNNGMGRGASEHSQFVVRAELEGHTTYRFNVATASGVPALPGWVEAPEYDWIETSNSGAITELTTIDSGTYSIYFSLPSGNSQYSAEVYDSVSSPMIDIDRGDPDDPDSDYVNATWVADSFHSIEGYAVVVDGSPSTIPSLSVIQEIPVWQSTLAPGDYWLHVRAVDVNGAAGTTSHRRMRVAPIDTTFVLDAPAASPGSPGYVTTTEPELSVSVPSYYSGDVRFVLREKGSGRWVWGDTSAIQGGEARISVPRNTLNFQDSYVLSVRGIGPGGSVVMGQFAEFTVDAGAPRAPSGACEAPDCHLTGVELFAGSIPGGDQVTLDVSELNSDVTDWVDRVHLEIEAGGSETTQVGVFAPDRSLPTEPTLSLTALDPSGSVQASPDASDTVVVRNMGEEMAEFVVRAIAWQSGNTQRMRSEGDAVEGQAEELMDQASDERYDADAHESSFYPGGVAQEPDPSIQPAMICAEADLDVVTACAVPSPALAADEEVQPVEPASVPQSKLMVSGAMASSRLAASAIPPHPTLSKFMRSNGIPEECHTGHSLNPVWISLNRMTACRVLTPSYTANKRTLFFFNRQVGEIEYAILELMTFNKFRTVGKYKARAVYIRSEGVLESQPLTVAPAFRCVPPACDDVNIYSNMSTQVISPANPQSAWQRVEMKFEVPSVSQVVDVDRYSMVSSVTASGSVGSTLPLKYSTPSSIRCDSKIQRGSGCVFSDITAVLSMPGYRYPTHVELVLRGQALLWRSPGAHWLTVDDGFETRPLVRISEGDGRTNRRMARKLCRDLPTGGDCDEYPYNASRQGCSLGLLESPLSSRACEVQRTPSRENSGAGAWVLARQQEARVLYEDEYYVYAYRWMPEVT